MIVQHYEKGVCEREVYTAATALKKVHDDHTFATAELQCVMVIVCRMVAL